MPLRIGDTFAGYRVLRLLGSGGMGEVYLVQHPRLPRQDALKVLRPEVSSDPSFRDRFIREADLASGLRHPHIVGIHDRGEHDGQLWIAMDYIDGTDAGQLTEKRYPAGMPAELAVSIITAVASALDYAHKKGLLHRDVKPANIMVADLDTDDPGVFLTDFGIARSLDDTSGITTTNMTVGTVAYAAPEQLMGEDIDGRADQYALAATAYFLLTGTQVYPHINPAVVISKHLNATPRALASFKPEFARLDPVLTAGLAKNPQDRFRSCSDFGKALAEQALTSRSASALAPTTPASLVPRPAELRESVQPRPPAPVRQAEHRSRRWMMGAGVAALVIGIILAVIWPRHERPSAAPTSIPSPTPISATSTSVSPPATFSAKVIDDLLLGAGEVNDLVGAATLEVQKSSFGTADHSSAVTPAACVGIAYGAEQRDYGNTGFVQMRDQTLGFRPYTETESYSAGHPWRVQQTVVVYPSAQQAQTILASTETRWRSCAGEQVMEKGYEFTTPWELRNIQLRGDVITVSVVDPTELGPQAGACQHALGVRANVVAEAVTCTSETKIPGSGSERLVLAILDKVRI